MIKIKLVILRLDRRIQKAKQTKTFFCFCLDSRLRGNDEEEGGNNEEEQFRTLEFRI
jgi:hypothetical protein